MNYQANKHSETNLRKHARLPLELTAQIALSDGVHVSGKTKNISFGGAFFYFPQISALVVGDECKFSLVLEGGHNVVLVNFKAKVKHIRPEGIGLKFLAIYAENYHDFVNLMVHNSDDPEMLLEELAKHPGIELQG
ncbi:MAG: PilZ domain-containing protein [Gammaproteobacteria bacterium]|nr:PilZ domain-containing protein [Gammaproteobacteria bacterium]